MTRWVACATSASSSMMRTRRLTVDTISRTLAEGVGKPPLHDAVADAVVLVRRQGHGRAVVAGIRRDDTALDPQVAPRIRRCGRERDAKRRLSIGCALRIPRQAT